MLSIRRATQADYADVVHWMAELAVNDTPPTRDRWQNQYMTGTVIAEQGRQAAGYAFYQINDEEVYVRNIVTAPAFRRSGVARALMRWIAEHARDEGAQTWRLNVKPDNRAALGLYESLGMHRKHASAALRIDFDACAQLRAARQVERIVSESDWATLEARHGLASGMIASRAEHGDAVLATCDMHGRGRGLRSLAVLDLGFPGAFVFKPEDVPDAEALLRSMAAQCPSGSSILQVVVENDEPMIEHLVERGARVQMRFVHYEGEL